MKIRAYLQLTKACNLQCKMCDFWKNKNEDLSKNHFIRLIDTFVAHGMKGITFWGWEPFLCPDIYDLVRHSKEVGLKTEIITNGVLMNQEKMTEIIPYLDEIIFSIDSGTPFIHNTIRGGFPYVFEKATSNLELVARLRDEIHPNLYIAIDTTIQKWNWKTFDSVLGLAKKYNTKINFDPVQLLGYGNDKKDELLITEDEAWELEWRLLGFKKENPAYVIQSKESIKRIIRYFKGYKIENYCSSLNNDLLVDPFGNVLQCWGNGKALYNILEAGSIRDDKLRMDQSCYSCGFTHVRDDDYFSGYSVTNDVFEGNTYVS